VVLQYVIATGLKLSHPIIPFVTEEIWTRLGEEGLLVDQEFPKSRDLEMFYNSKLNVTVLKSMKLVKEIRSLKTRLEMKAKSTPQMFLDIPPSELPDIGLMKLHIESLAACKLICESPPADEKSNFITVIFQMDGKICKMSTPKVSFML
jgi:valyl-tRNA synthetase